MAKVKRYYLEKIIVLENRVAILDEYCDRLIARVNKEAADRKLLLRMAVHPWIGVWAALTGKLRRIARKEGR